MQFPVSNLRPDRFHCLVRSCRTEVDEVFPLAILRSPRPKCIAQKIDLLVQIRHSPLPTETASARNSKCTCSRTGKSFNSERSQLFTPGPRRIKRAALPKVPTAGSANTSVGKFR